MTNERNKYLIKLIKFLQIVIWLLFITYYIGQTTNHEHLEGSMTVLERSIFLSLLHFPKIISIDTTTL